MSDSYKAVVQKVVDGKHGWYAVATEDQLGTVTFSLGKEVWGEKSHPERGVYVILEEIVKKRAGWRALKARFLKPEDEKEKTAKKKNNQQKRKETVNEED